VKNRQSETIKIALMLVCAAFFVAVIWIVNDFFAPLFLNSRIERLGETNLPKIMVENGNIVYCRMKADDFRFPLPPNSRAVNPIVTGGFDTVDGTIQVQFDSTNRITPYEYGNWLSGRIQIGASITSETISNGLLIKFHYFGDK